MQKSSYEVLFNHIHSLICSILSYPNFGPIYHATMGHSQAQTFTETEMVDRPVDGALSVLERVATAHTPGPLHHTTEAFEIEAPTHLSNRKRIIIIFLIILCNLTQVSICHGEIDRLTIIPDTFTVHLHVHNSSRRVQIQLRAWTRCWTRTGELDGCSLLVFATSR